MPAAVKSSFGLRIYELQQGRAPLNMKSMTGFGGGVHELRDSFDGDAFRVVYVINLRKALYVLHAFKKKSKSGISLPRPDIALIEARLKRARELDVKED